MIQFIRYAPLVAERGGRVILNCPAELALLLREIPQIAEVISGDELPEFDCHCPMLSLPAIFKSRLESIPATTPYLKAPVDIGGEMAGTLGGVMTECFGSDWRGRAIQNVDWIDADRLLWNS